MLKAKRASVDVIVIDHDKFAMWQRIFVVEKNDVARVPRALGEARWTISSADQSMTGKCLGAQGAV